MFSIDVVWTWGRADVCKRVLQKCDRIRMCSGHMSGLWPVTQQHWGRLVRLGAASFHDYYTWLCGTRVSEKSLFMTFWFVLCGKPALFVLTSPFVCIWLNSSQLDAKTTPRFWFCDSLTVLPLTLNSRHLSRFSVFNRPHPTHPEIQKEMSRQLGKEEEVRRSSFCFGETR